MVGGSCSWTTTASGNRDSPEMTGKWNVWSEREETCYRALCKFSGGITRRLASWLGQFLPVALQDSQDSGQMAFAAKELPGCDKGQVVIRQRESLQDPFHDSQYIGAAV